MKKKILTIGLVGSMVFTSVAPVMAADVEGDIDNIEIVQEIKDQVLSLTLQEAIDYALEHSRDMIIQNLEMEKAELSYKQNRRAVRQQEDALDRPSSNFSPLPEDMTPEIRESLIAAREQATNSDAIVNRSLVRNGVTMRQVELAHDIAGWNLAKKENEIKYNVEKAYFDLLQMKEELNIAEENYDLSIKQFNQGELRYDLGMLSKQQLLNLELGLYQAQTGVEAAKTYYELQELAFKNTLGIALGQEIELTDGIEFKEHEEVDLAKSIENANENNVNIKMAEENFELSKLTLKSVSGRFPSNTYRYKEQEVEVQKSAKDLEDMIKGVEAGVRSSYLSLKTSKEQIAILEKSVEQAKEAVRIAEISFEVGQITSVDVTQANIALMNAKLNLSKQVHAYNLALLDFEYSTGIGR